MTDRDSPLAQAPAGPEGVASRGDSGAVAPHRPGLWRSLREALSGSEQDFTTGSLGRAVFLLDTSLSQNPDRFAVCFEYDDRARLDSSGPTGEVGG